MVVSTFVPVFTGRPVLAAFQKFFWLLCHTQFTHLSYNGRGIKSIPLTMISSVHGTFNKFPSKPSFKILSPTSMVIWNKLSPSNLINNGRILSMVQESEQDSDAAARANVLTKTPILRTTSELIKYQRGRMSSRQPMKWNADWKPKLIKNVN